MSHSLQQSFFSPCWAFPVSPGKTGWNQDSEHRYFYHRDWIMWQAGLVLAASCSECGFLLKPFPGCWQAPGFQELSPVLPSENRGSGGIYKNPNSEQPCGFQNFIWLSKAFSRRVDLGQNECKHLCRSFNV